MTVAARQLSLFKGRRQRGVKPKPVIERKTHIAIADALRAGCSPGWEWTHFPAGEHRTEKTGALLKRMGMKKGWSDFVLMGPDGVHHWLELKRGNAPLTEEQEGFRDACDERGVPWAVARSFNEAIAVLQRWGALDRLTVTA
jgi:hypothetical protein